MSALEDLSADFHVWGCEFTPQRIDYYFDGRLVQSLDATIIRHGSQNIWLTSVRRRVPMRKFHISRRDSCAS
jgi:hypothetical protein